MLATRRQPRVSPPTPTAPRMNPCPLPDIGRLLAASPVTIPRSQPPPTPKPSTSTSNHRRHRTDESGYSSSAEPSSSQRTRPTSQAVRSPLAPPPPPLKGILKSGSSESSVVFRASLVQQDRDGYASSSEKPPPLRTSQSRSSKSRPPPRKLRECVSFQTDEFAKRSIAPADSSSSSSSPSSPPATLHWKLLPFDAQRSKGKVKFDFAHEVDEILLAEGRQGSARPLSVQERNKSAAEPSLTEMVIHCAELPDWPVHVARQSGIRCVDVFEAIRDTYNVVLTTTERTIHQSRVRDIERRRPPTPEGAAAKKGVRRRDLLDGKTLFLGLDWRASDSRYPDGCWCLKVGSPPSR
ncbi:hypothetical protein EDB84DRAFT_1561148 [Lactarius hengduanensis]|nr:hypothetical protein EDB84DRAFT_1561148 [Lactarius hengduanensis]